MSVIGRSALALALFAGCAGTSLQGTVDGQALTASAAVVGKFVDNETMRSLTTLLITDAVNPCQMIRDNKNQKNTGGLLIFLGKKSGAVRAAALEPGTYIVSPAAGLPEGPFAVVWAIKQNEACENVISESKMEGVQGKVVVEEISEAGPAVGTFDVQFPGGDKVAGEFSAGYCDAQPATEEPTCG